MNSCKAFKDSIEARYNNTVAETSDKMMKSLNTLETFYETHKDMLGEYNDSIEAIKEETTLTHLETVKIKLEHGGQLNSKTAIPISEHFNKLVVILQNAIDTCVKEMESIY